jgi:hypothetical protein
VLEKVLVLEELAELENQIEDWDSLSDHDKWQMIAQVEALLTASAAK